MDENTREDPSLFRSAFSGIGEFVKTGIQYTLIAGLAPSLLKLGRTGISKVFGAVTSKTNIGQKLTSSDAYKNFTSKYTTYKNYINNINNKLDTNDYKEWLVAEKNYKDKLYSIDNNKRYRNVGALVKEQSTYYFDRIQRFFKYDDKLIDRIQGLAITESKKLAKDMILFYTIDNTIASENAQKNPLKYAQENITSFGVLNLIQGQFGYLANLPSRGIKKILSKTKADKWMPPLIAHINKIDNSLTAGYHSVAEIVNNYKHSDIDKTIFRGIASKIDGISSDIYRDGLIKASSNLKKSYLSGYKDNNVYNLIKRSKDRVYSFVHDFKNIYNKNKQEVINNRSEMSVFLTAIKNATAILNTSKGTYDISNEQYIKVLKNTSQKFINSNYKNDHSGDIINNILKLKRAKITNKSLDRTLKQAEQSLALIKKANGENVFDPQTSKDFIKFLKKTDKYGTLVDSGVYSQGRNTVYDFRYINPKALLGRAINTLDRAFQAGAIRPLSFLRLPQTLGAKPVTSASFMSGESSPYIPPSLIKKEKLIHFDKYRLQDRSFYMNGQLYKERIKPDPATGDFFEPVLKGHLKVVRTQGMKDIHIKTQESFNIIGKDVKVKFDISNISAWLKDRFDFNTPFLKYFKKYSDESSPLFLKKSLDEITKKQGNIDYQIPVDELKKASIQIQNILRFAESHKFGIFLNRDFLRQVKINPYEFSDNQLIKAVENNIKYFDNIDIDDPINQSLQQHIRTLNKDKGINFTLNQISTDSITNILNTTKGSSSLFNAYSNRENLRDFFVQSEIMRRYGYAGIKDINAITKTLFEKGSLTELEKASINISLNKREIFSSIKHDKRKFQYSSVERMLNQVNEYSEDYLTVAKEFKKIRTPYYDKDIYYQFKNLTDTNIFKNELGFRNSGYITIPTKEHPLNINNRTITRSEYYPKLLATRWNEFLGEQMPFNLDMSKYSSTSDYIVKGIFGRRILPLTAGIYGLNLADKLTASFPLLNQTPLDDGFIQMGANMFVRGRQTLAGLYDITGITSANSYLEGLMPGVINSPLMRGVRAVGSVMLGSYLGRLSQNPKGGMYGLLAGMGFSALQGFGTFDMTKSKEDIENIYSGREDVPVKSGRWWLFGQGNYAGTRVNYFQPNWYARMTAQARGKTLGGVFERTLFEPMPLLNMNPIGDLISPNHYQKRLQYSYPAPNTGSVFEEVPVIGNLLSIASQMSPLGHGGVNIRSQEWKDLLNENNIPVNDLGSSMSMAENYLGVNPIINKTSIRYNIDDMMYKSQEILGLWGFASNAIMDATIGGKPFQSQIVMESGRSISSRVRQYWDANIGDPLLNTEILRRLQPKSTLNKESETYNPLTNAMPYWLPANLQLGNIMNKVQNAEIRAPGYGYETLHNVNKEYPISAKYLGLSLEDTTRALLGLYKKDNMALTHEIALSDNNEKIKERGIYSSALDIDSTYSKISMINNRRVVEKTIQLNDKQVKNFNGADPSQLSDMNFVIKQTGADVGLINFEYNGAIINSQRVDYSQEKYVKDINILNAAKERARQLESQGYGYSGYSYSHKDRLSILADIAPNSDEYFREKYIVEQQIKNGKVELQGTLDKVNKQVFIKSLRTELYPYRFKGKVMNPTSSQNIYNLNENIKSADSYNLLERTVGGLYERFSHIQTPIHNRFMNYRTPLEEYQRSYLYGRNIKLWDSPIEHWFKPYMEGMMSKDDPVSGMIAGFTAGYSFGGFNMPLGIIGGIAGGIYGGTMGMVGLFNDNTYIPGRVKKEREVNKMFDELTYEKNRLMYEYTGDEKYKRNYKATLHYTNTSGAKINRNSMIKGMYKQERDFVKIFIDEKNTKEQQEILRYMPTDVGSALTTYWEQQQQNIYNTNMGVTDVKYKGMDFGGFEKDVDLNDVKYAYIASEGMDNYSFGLGYLNQQRKLNERPYLNYLARQLNKNIEPTYDVEAQNLKKQIDDVLNKFKVIGHVRVMPSNVQKLTINNG